MTEFRVMQRPSPSTPCASCGAPADVGKVVQTVATPLSLLIALAALTACHPAPAGPTPNEVAGDALKAQGARDALVQLQSDSFRATVTQGDGRTSQVAVGAGTVTASDLGAPWYPGATPDAARTSKVSSADGQVATVHLATPDKPDRVLGFYRERLAAVAGGAVRESQTSDGATSLVLADEAGSSATQVVVASTAGGSEITLLTTRRAPR